MHACSTLGCKRVPGFERSPPSPHCFIFPYGIGLLNNYSTSSIPLRCGVSLSCGWRCGGGAREASRLSCNTMAVLADPKESSLAIRLFIGRFNPNWWSWCCDLYPGVCTFRKMCVMKQVEGSCSPPRWRLSWRSLRWRPGRCISPRMSSAAESYTAALIPSLQRNKLFNFSLFGKESPFNLGQKPSRVCQWSAFWAGK